jgi:Subtilase family
MSGKIITEGDKSLKADIARSLFNVNGLGIKIGIISTSFDAHFKAAIDVASGDLPGIENPNGEFTPVSVLKDITKDSPVATDEGRALAQVIHDIAPKSTLLFHTAVGGGGKTPETLNSEESYTTAVDALVKAGANIIVSDIQFNTTFFQDAQAATAVENAISQGVVYVAAAGNNGKLSYQSDYRTDGNVFSIGGRSFELYNFDATSGVDMFQDIAVSKDNTVIAPALSWDNKIGGVADKLKMFLLSSPNVPKFRENGNILAISNSPDPNEPNYPLQYLAYTPTKDQKLYLAIGRELNGEPPPHEIKWNSTANGQDRGIQYEYVNYTDQNEGSSTIFGPANSEDAITVGATDYQQNNGGSPLEIRSYSSRGSSPILFDDQGNSLLNPKIRTKPEVTAPDGVSTTFDAGTSFNPFRGTSAFAAHIAGVVALMEQAAGGSNALSPRQIKMLL